MAVTITVMYENTEDATFDLEYYLTTHMPLVSEKFTPFGMKSWRVLKAVPGPGGSKAPYSIIANLEFDTADQFAAAAKAEGAAVFGDIPNFSNKGANVVVGDHVGAG